jgi:F0F1-type ATP synthase membrane subunit b/b'
MRRLLNKRGQSTLEYAIIWTAIIAAILLAANTIFRPHIENAVGEAGQKIEDEVTRLTGGVGGD